MVEVYVNLVRVGVIKLEDVPSDIRDEVAKLL
ncbi:MAG: CD1375 family protein [Eubacteriales bacterium]